VEYQAAPFGIVGLETAIGLVLTELFHKHVLSLQQIIEKLSTNPRRVAGLPPIVIGEGMMANLTIFDPAAEWVVSPETFRSRSRNTPFGGRRLKGRPVGILNNGQEFWL
jgi:dihydroorotase